MSARTGRPERSAREIAPTYSSVSDPSSSALSL